MVKVSASATHGQIKAFADRIERLDEEIKTINSDKSEIFKEAKAYGLDVGVLKLAINRRRKLQSDPDLLHASDEMLDLYLAAIMGDAGSVAQSHQADEKGLVAGKSVAANGSKTVSLAHAHDQRAAS